MNTNEKIKYSHDLKPRCLSERPDNNKQSITSHIAVLVFDGTHDQFLDIIFLTIQNTHEIEFIGHIQRCW